MFPFRSTILHEKSQLHELNSRLESYLAGVRELEKENEMITTEIRRLRQAGRTEESHPSVGEVHEMRWQLEELAVEKARAEMQRRNLQQEIEELRNCYAAEKTLHKNTRQEVEAHQRTLQQIEGTNASLEDIIFQLQAEYQTLKAQHEQAKWEAAEEVRRARNILVTQSYPTTHVDFENHSLAFSEIWQENFEVYRNKIEELEAAVQEDKGRSEDLNRENLLLISEIEALKKDLEDQFILQSQLEQDFLTFQQRHGVEMEDYQREVEALEDEKQRLTSAIAVNLKEQQKLMQVQMGLNLELATYRALLEAEHRKQQEIGEQLWKFKKGMDTRLYRYNVMPGPMLDTLDVKLRGKNVPSTFRRDAVKSNIGITSMSIPYRTSTRKINSSFLDKDLLYDKKSSSVQNVDSSTRSKNTYKGVAGSMSAPRDSFSTMKQPQAQHKMFPQENKSQMVLPRQKNEREEVIHKSRILVTESVSKNETDVSENRTKAPRSSDQLTPFSEMEHYDGNLRSSQPEEEEEYKRQYSKNVITFEPDAKQLEFKADLSDVGSFASPDRDVPAAMHQANAEKAPQPFISDNIEKNEEELTPESEEVTQPRSSPEELGHYRRVIVSEEGIMTDDDRIRDVIEAVIKPTELGKMLSPETAVTYHIEEKEVLEDGTTKQDVIIQSKSEATVDVADEDALQEMLNMDTKDPEVQLKGALEHLTGSETGCFIDGQLNLDIKRRETPGKVSVNVEIKEQMMSEIDDLPAPADATPFYARAEEGDLEGTNSKYDEVLNVTMSAADFRKTMLLPSEPESQKFQDRPTSFPMVENTEEEKDEAELYGINEQHESLQNLYGDEYTENTDQAKFTPQDSFAKELQSPRIIEESVKIPQGVQASIVELLKEETEDPKLKLKGALEQLKEAVPDNLRDELSLLTGEIEERSNVSVSINNVQQSSESGVVTIEAQVNVSQSLDPEDFFSMEKFIEEDVDKIGSGLAFLNSQQELQRLMNGKGLQMVECSNDEGRITANPQIFKEERIYFEPNAEDVEEYSSTQGHTGYQITSEMIGSSEMEDDVTHWSQKDTDKDYGEEFINKISDPVDSSVSLHMNVNRIISMHTSGGGSEGSMSFIAQEQHAEGTDGSELDNNLYCYEEWESGSRGVLAVTGEIKEKDQQTSDSELLQYPTSPKVLTKHRVIVSESISQVVHGEQDNSVTYLDENQQVTFPQSDDEP
ncbi:synemin [Mobula hypostoma]|uniref:synemin n=1 Tax=Mobula hypostoma TaxID=723540 RepID=UPI002FC30F20